MGDDASWVADADIRLRDRGVWRVDGLRVVRNLLQVSIRSQHVLLFASDGWGDDGGTVVVGDSSLSAHSGDSQDTDVLK